ncbi:MAG: TIGR04282 family arsenosugar biosynthesis glycosyltransferase [Gammaproteobacteria bacterium]
MNYRFPKGRILVFCKAPVPGSVKTRLIPPLSPGEAADLHRELAAKTLERCHVSRLCPVQLWCSPAIEHPFFNRCAADFGVTLHLQQGADLGEKMDHAMRSALSGSDYALLLGCDCPSLTAENLADALRALRDGREVALAPAIDGGYVLIGLRRPRSELFGGIHWGESTVLESTLRRIWKLDLDCFTLPEQWDLDTPADLNRYRSMLQ